MGKPFVPLTDEEVEECLAGVDAIRETADRVLAVLSQKRRATAKPSYRAQILCNAIQSLHEGMLDLVAKQGRP
jgi:hypothetical protein